MLKISSFGRFGISKVDLSNEILTADEKNWLGQKIVDGHYKQSWVSKYYSISKQLVHKYTTSVKKGLALKFKAGRPSFISQESKEEIRNFLQSGKCSKRTSEYENKLQEVIEKEALAQGKSPSQVHYPSRSTIGRLELELVIHTGNAEKISDARAMAVADVGSAVSFATMNQLVVTPLIDPHLILNADATQFTVGDTGAEKEKLKYIGKRGTKALKEEPRKENCGIVKYSIKYLLLISAAGYQSDPVYILADDFMGAEDLDVH